MVIFHGKLWTVNKRVSEAKSSEHHPIIDINSSRHIIWLVGGPPLWKIWVRQLGWLDTQYFWENKKWQPNHQPVYHCLKYITDLPAHFNGLFLTYHGPVGSCKICPPQQTYAKFRKMPSHFWFILYHLFHTIDPYFILYPTYHTILYFPYIISPCHFHPCLSPSTCFTRSKTSLVLGVSSSACCDQLG